MSKTDKTRPYWVKVRDKHAYLTENHDHRNGVCNLPERPTPNNKVDHNWSRYWQSGDCEWITTSEWFHSGDSRCPCYMCGYDAYDTPRRLRERREGKRYCQDGWRDEY